MIPVSSMIPLNEIHGVGNVDRYRRSPVLVALEYPMRYTLSQC